jgi:hypothetical protein
MTPYEVVREKYAFPFDFRQYQVDEFNYLAPYDRAGYYWDPGTGKTAAGTHHALYWSLTGGIDQWVFVLPNELLLLQWKRWLDQVKHLESGRSPTVSVYYGSPRERKSIDLDNEFTLTTLGVFKNDFDYLHDSFADKKVGGAVDEAKFIKNVKSDNHKAVKLFFENRPLLLLEGTPLAKPGDAYAYIRLLTNNKIYRNQRHFSQLHVQDEDEYGNVTKWTNLDLLAQNMKVQSSRVIRREVRKELPSTLYVPVPYELAPQHLKLYNRLAEEKLVELEQGGEISALSAPRLRAMLQQIVCNWAHFEQDPTRRPAVMDVIENTFEEIGPERKLMIVANFQMTNRYLLEHLKPYGTVAVYGEVSPKEKSLAIEKFIDDPRCQCILVQPQAAGMGVDGLQHVCSDALVVEAPPLALHFHQTLARLDRDGQEEAVTCRIAIAQKTIQVKLFRDLLNNDAMVNSIQGGFKDLKDEIYGR